MTLLTMRREYEDIIFFEVFSLNGMYDIRLNVHDFVKFSLMALATRSSDDPGFVMVSPLCHNDWKAFPRSGRCISTYSTFISKFKKTLIENDNRFMSNDCCMVF